MKIKIERHIKYLVFILAILPKLTLGQTTTNYTTAGTYYWTAPCDVTSIKVECWGGGGAGGGATVTNPSAGGGGSGGAYTKNTSISVVPGTTYTITVGAGGTGSTGDGNPGNPSWFGATTTIMAVGGAGGAGSTSGTASGAAAVTSGNVGGTVNYYGGGGGTSSSGGGGGGGAGTASAGNTVTGSTGAVAVTGGGAGASGPGSNSNGSAGGTTGGGGSGAKRTGGGKSGGDGGDGKVSITYTTTAVSYCSPSFPSNVEPITNVTFAGINNSTSSTLNGTPALEVFCSVSGTVGQGSTGNVISISGNTDGSYTDYITVFIDWNIDGDFLDAGETFNIGTINNSSTSEISSTIDVPCTAAAGTTRMRVSKLWGGYPTSCQSTGYGQAEDYVLIVTASSGTTPTSQPTGLTLTATSGTQVNGSFTTATSNPAYYLVVRTSSSSAPSPAPVDGTTYTAGGSVGGGVVISAATSATTSFSSTGLSGNTAYWYWVYSYNNPCSPKYRTTSPLSATITTPNIVNWIGQGVSGGTGGTDFNTGSNWSTGSVPGVNDNANITTTTAATITLSANVTIGSLTMLNNSSSAITLALDATTKVLTINGDLIANVKATTTNATVVSLRVGNSPGNIIVGGSTVMGDNGNGSGYIGFTGSGSGSTTGTFTFKGDATFSVGYGPLSGSIGTYIWDGTGTQTIYTNSTYTVPFSSPCQIGNTNTPTVVVSSTTSSGLYLSTSGANLTVKAGSTLDLSTKIWNKSTAGGVLTLEAGSKLKLGATTGGQTGSNFPSGFTTYTLSPTSIVEYTGTGSQTIYNVASPGYGHLTLTNNSTKSATGGLNIQGNVTINSTSTFAAGTSLTHNVGGNWSNNGSFSYTTDGTIVFNGASNQSIGGSATTSFYNLTNTNSSTGLTLGHGILVAGTLAMSGATANINLNGYNIDLSTAGTITGESNTDRIYGTSGVITTTRNLSNISALDIGGMGCVLTTTANMGSTTISRGHAAQSGSGLTHTTINRYYTISPTTNSGLNATLKFNYFDNELNGLSSNESNFELYRSTNGGSTWTERFGSVNAASNYVSLAGIDAFSVWTVSYPDPIALPISLVTFDAKNEGKTNVISWVTMTELNNDFFTVERSVDGKQFEVIAKVDGAGTSMDINQYKIEDYSYSETINYYRLLQTDIDGTVRYSGLVSVDNRISVKEILKVINIHGQEVDEHYKGVVIIVYTDGTVLRTVRNL